MKTEIGGCGQNEKYVLDSGDFGKNALNFTYTVSYSLNIAKRIDR